MRLFSKFSKENALTIFPQKFSNYKFHSNIEFNCIFYIFVFFLVFQARETLRKMRFNACGSAALPDSVLDAWMELSGHVSKSKRKRKRKREGDIVGNIGEGKLGEEKGDKVEGEGRKEEFCGSTLKNAYGRIAQ